MGIIAEEGSTDKLRSLLEAGVATLIMGSESGTRTVCLLRTNAEDIAKMLVNIITSPEMLSKREFVVWNAGMEKINRISLVGIGS